MGRKIFRKKLQVFISSTFLDLKDERQAAVEAILGFDHIPAGMELFKAGNESQLNTIKRWIDQSDLYLLILGGRYGSIEKESKKSYTHLEYDYAISKGIPVFSVVLSDKYLANKSKYDTDNIIYEKDNIEEYISFKKYVQTRMVKEVSEIKDIKIVIYESIRELERDYTFTGWIPGDSYIALEADNSHYDSESSIKNIKREMQTLKEKLASLELYNACHKLSCVTCIQYSYLDFNFFSLSDIFDRDLDSIEFHSIDIFKHVSLFFSSGDMLAGRLKKKIITYLKDLINTENYDARFVKLRKSDIIGIISEWCLCGIIEKTYVNSIEFYSITKFGKDVLAYLYDIE